MKAFIKELLLNDVQVELKGGNVLALYYNCPELLNDWDFCVDKSYANIVESIYTNHYTITKTGTYVDVYKCNNQELSINKLNNSQSELELPLSTIKITITNDNIDALFDLDYDYKYKFNIPKSQNGFFDVVSIDRGNKPISDQMFDIIMDTAKNNNMGQFLITHIKEPDRMFYRLPNKSIKKSDLLKTYGHNDSFLLDVDLVNNLVHTFCLNVNLAIEKMINKDVAELLKDLDVLFCNINIGRLASQLTTDYDIDNIKCMFEVLINNIDLKIMRKNASNKFINLLFCLRKIEKKKA